ncbi:hypothetical protein B8W70_27290 [Pseudomonas sp. 1239]|uniref:hypothetical protein n=1 Tax=unclassified Pseudomonas TaxID=196821 RepID=UPI000B4F0FB4|nr:hypothetical protein [Pseudomonas sp. 1239]OUM22500.1 hypothetical protein B8W70_27290 [Pseudomonas sp. 1239]
MQLCYAANMHGIFNRAFPTEAQPVAGGCRVVVHRGVLYCAYNAGGNVAEFVAKVSGIDVWTTPTVLPLMVTPSRSLALFVFKDKVHAFRSDNQGVFTLAAYNDTLMGFEPLTLSQPMHGSPSLVEFQGQLYAFYRHGYTKQIECLNSEDLENWGNGPVFRARGVAVTTPDDPIAIVYQGLIHLFYKDGDGRTLLLKYDGQQAWTEPRVFIEQAYPFMPGVTVHAGLLKLAFTRSIANADGRALYQYAYDGNTLSPATVTSNLTATERVGLGVLNGELFALFQKA